MEDQARSARFPEPGGWVVLGDGSLIDIDDLPESLRGPIDHELTTDETFLPLEEVQRRHIMRVLEAVGGHKARAAEILGIGRATIYQMLSKMKIEEKERSC